MAVNPLMQSIRDAIRSNREMDRLFARVGNKDHPRGSISVAYRQVVRSISADPSSENVRQVLETLRDHVSHASRGFLIDSGELGKSSASRQIGFYGDRAATVPVDYLAINQGVDAVLQILDAQAQSARAMSVLGSDPVLIVGDQSRRGVLRDSAIATALAFWMVSLRENGYRRTVAESGFVAQKQAVAALDNRTTNCCLRVHGQIREFDKSFKLTGTPRYADELESPPFHFFCRTAMVLYRESYDLGLTARMRSGADFILSERAAGKNPTQSPADAFWS